MLKLEMLSVTQLCLSCMHKIVYILLLILKSCYELNHITSKFLCRNYNPSSSGYDCDRTFEEVTKSKLSI